MIDWKKHFEIFSGMDDTSPTARKIYAEQHGLKDNTMRCNFAKFRKLNLIYQAGEQLQSSTTRSVDSSKSELLAKMKDIKKGKKVDYLKQCKQFLKKIDTSAKARQAYALNKRLNDNTFRAHLSKYIKSDGYKRSLEQQSILNEIKKRKNYVDIQQSISNPHLSRLEDGRRAFIKGNNSGLTHGRYSSATPQIKSRTELSLKLDQLRVIYSDYIKIIENDYAAGKPIILKKLTENKIINIEVSKLDAISEVEGQITPEIIKYQILIKQLDTLNDSE